LKNPWSIFDRTLEIVDYMNNKYVRILEEVVEREAEILAKKELDEVDKLRLIGLNLMKEIIAEELGLQKPELKHVEIPEIYTPAEKSATAQASS